MRIDTLPPIIDHYDDRGAHFLRELSGLPVPEFVKTAADVSTASEISAADYALNIQTSRGSAHKFPTFDKGNTFISALYFEKTAQSLPQEARKEAAINLAAAIHDFDLVVPSYIQNEIDAPIVKTATVHAIESTFAQRTLSEAEFVEEFAGVHPMHRPEAARLIKQAGVELPAAIACYAREELGTDFEAALIARAMYMPSDSAPFIRDLIKVAHTVPPEELAEALYEIDQEFGLTRLYDTRIQDPYRAVLGTELLIKNASAAVDIDGRVFTADEISSLAVQNTDAIDDVFGGGLSSQLVAAPVEVLSSLPMPHKQAIARIFNGNSQ